MTDLALDATLRRFAGELRTTLLVAPSPELAEAQVAEMLTEARPGPPSATAVATPITRRRRRPLLRLAVVAAAGLAVLTGGLAVAGVRPPEPISDLLEGIGVDVPGSDSERTHEARKAAEPTEPHGSSSEHRAGDAAAGEGNGSPADQGHRAEDHGGHENRNGGGPGANGNGEQASAEGQETAAEASGGQTPPSEPGNSENHPAPQGQGGQGAPPAHSHGTPPSGPQADAPGQSGNDTGPPRTLPRASGAAGTASAAHANGNAGLDASPE